jgi:cytidylate kinase
VAYLFPVYKRKYSKLVGEYRNFLVEWTGMKIIGLSGTNGSGKDTVGYMLAERHKFLFVSGSDMLRAEARARGEEPTREVLRTISAEWRRESGHLGVLIDKAVEQYEQVAEEYPGGLVIASLRNPGEADRVHELDGVVVWTDADQKVRYDRIIAHAAERNRYGEDHKTFEQFSEEEAAEMTTSGDTATLNMAAVKERADIFVKNDGNDLEAFKYEAELALKLENIIE